MQIILISECSYNLFTVKISTATGKAARTGRNYCPFAEGAVQSWDGGAAACCHSNQNVLPVLQKSSQVASGSAVRNFLVLANESVALNEETDFRIIVLDT